MKSYIIGLASLIICCISSKKESATQKASNKNAIGDASSDLAFSNNVAMSTLVTDRE